MKPWLLFGAIALPFLETAVPSRADDGSEKCSNAGLEGRYGLATHGERLGTYDAANSSIIHFHTSPVRFDIVSEETFDGHGNATVELLVSTGGVGQYRVNPDCTGVEETVFPGSAENMRALVLSNRGRTIHMLWTRVHFPAFPAAALPAGATCDPPTGCGMAVQAYSDGERY